MKFEDITVKKGERLTVRSGYAYVCDEEDHITRAFKVTNGDLLELDIEELLEKLAEYLKDKIDTKAFIKDFLSVKYSLKGLVEIEERIDRGAKVRERSGCYRLDIYGKRNPLKLWLVEPNR